MNKDRKDKILSACRMIADDMKSDMNLLEGKPFTGSNVAEQFGNQAAAIATLAKIIGEMIGETE